MQDRLDAYLARLGLDAAPLLDAGGLEQLQAAHRRAVTFENLDILLGRGIRIDPDAVFAKIVERGRGGYCFEQNRLFADMLAAQGLPTRPLLARARLAIAEGIIPPRTHVLLLARIEGQDWIVDVGFGGTDLPPLPLVDGAKATSPEGTRYRLRRIDRPDGEWLLERAGSRDTTDGRALPHGDWQTQYSFDLAHVDQADLDQANHWTSTWPESRFVLAPRLSRVLPHGFAALTGTALSVSEDGRADKRELASETEWRDAVSGIFGITLSVEEVARLSLFEN